MAVSFGLFLTLVFFLWLVTIFSTSTIFVHLKLENIYMNIYIRMYQTMEDFQTNIICLFSHRYIHILYSSLIEIYTPNYGNVVNVFGWIFYYHHEL